MNALKLNQEQLAISWKNRSVDFLHAYQDQNVPLMLRACDNDCAVSFVPLGDDGKGNAHETGKAIWNSLIDSFPNIDNTVHNATTTPEGVRCEVSIRGTQAKDFAGLPSKGNTFDVGHIFIFQVNDLGLISNITVDWDHEEFVRQLSL